MLENDAFAQNSDTFLAYVRAEGRLDQSQLLRAVAAAEQSGKRIDRVCLALGIMSEQEIAAALSKCFKIEQLTDVEDLKADTDFADVFDPEYLHKMNFIPLRTDGEHIQVAFADPLDEELIREIEFYVEKKISRFVAEPSLIEAALEQLFPLPLPQHEPIVSDEIKSLDAERLKALASEGPVISLIDDAIMAAVDRRASDIHFEGRDAGVAIRLRIDGVLSVYRMESTIGAAAIFSRIKVLADLNISERRQPQDGRIRLAIRGREIDFRVSSLPTQFGESIVMRVLDRSGLNHNFRSLGFSRDLETQIKSVLDQPNGLFLVTGPTGSGKTTTLYAALEYLNRGDLKLCSVEDPVEYTVVGVNQTQVHTSIGFTFAKALRAILRQDPNIVMVGEIRDPETAEIACRAALVGRLVLSTLHVNSAEEAIIRLRDLGVESYVIQAVLRGVLEQSLIPQACASCDKSGCEKCGFTGISGRKVKARLLVSPGEKE